MKKLKHIMASIAFQIGVNIIGLPQFHYIDFIEKTLILKSKFHK